MLIRLLVILAIGSVHAQLGVAGEFQVDASSDEGVIRPLHGVNGGPLNLGETIDLTEHYRTLRIPLVRLHDCEWPNPDVVDIHAVFPNEQADPAEAANYTFGRTDAYLQAIVNAEARIVYRLGESIELTRTKYHVHPPKDPDRWAEVCLGIIRHYNKGWADGHRHGIRYWEVWNEPENRPNMWTGDDEDYLRLYATTARKIKAEYPELKVGGPAAGSFGEVVDGRLQPTPFMEAFVRQCRKDDIPLDFFSWHTYSNNPREYAPKAKAIRKWLDAEGFEKAELHLNEWNFMPGDDWTPVSGTEGQGAERRRFYERQGGYEGAAFVCSTLSLLQDSPADAANYFCGDTNQWGLFDRFGAPKKTYFAFLAFSRMLETPRRLKVVSNSETTMTALAGRSKDGSAVQMLISNFDDQDSDVRLTMDRLPWESTTRCDILRLDVSHDLEPDRAELFPAGPIELTANVQPGAVLLIRFRPE